MTCYAAVDNALDRPERGDDLSRPLAIRSFEAETVNTLLHEAVAIHLQQRERVPYTTLQDVLGEAGVEPAALDQAIARLDDRKAAVEMVKPRQSWTLVAGAVLAIVCLLAPLTRHGVPAPTAQMPARPARTAAKSAPLPAGATKPEQPKRASASQLRQLQEQAVLTAGHEGFELVIHNPLRRSMEQVLARVKFTALGRQFDQRFRFDPGSPVEPYESRMLSVFHEMPEAPQVKSWKIEAAELQTEGR